MWIEAQTAEPSPEEKLSYEEKFQNVTDDGRTRGLDYAMTAEFGGPLEEVEDSILKESRPCFGMLKCSL